MHPAGVIFCSPARQTSGPARERSLLRDQAGPHGLTPPATKRRVCRLQFAHQIQTGLQGRRAGLPFGRADLVAVLGDELRGFQLAHQFVGIAADAQVVHLIGLDFALGIDDKSAAQGLARLFNVNPEKAGKPGGAVRKHGIADLGNAFGGVGPGFVHIGAVSGHGVNFAIQFPELVVMVGKVFQLRGADKSEVRRIEENNRPVSLQIRLADILQLAVVKGLDGEGFHFLIDQTFHDAFLYAEEA